MAIDPYALCPCGSGKKIKFCCGDLAGEMEKVQRMVEGDQPTAAVRRLQQLLKKHPRRTSLLDLKAAIEMQLGRLDDARRTIDEFLVSAPENANAWARRASILSLTDKPLEAVDALQRSLSFSDDAPYPMATLLAIRLLGRALAEHGDFVAAIAHFTLYADVSPPGDFEGEKELLQLTHEIQIPELIKGRFRWRTGPVPPALADQFEQAGQFARRGAWRKAAEMLERLKTDRAGSAVIIYNLALLQGFLGNRAAMISGLKDFALGGVPHEDAIESLALAQQLEEVDHGMSVPGQELTFEVDDVDAIADRCRVADCIVPIERSFTFWTSHDEEPPPQAQYFLLDRANPDDWAPLDLEDVPRVLASLEFFGRQTDRPPRVVARLTRDDQYDSKLASVRNVLGIDDQVRPHEARPMDLSCLGNANSYYSHVPETTPVESRLAIYEKAALKALREIWPEHPQKCLGGKSPSELANDSAKQLQLAAAVFRLFDVHISRRLSARAEPLWRQLNIERPSRSLDPQGTPQEALTFVRLRHVEAARLSDEQLTLAIFDAHLLGASRTTAHLGPELLKRPQLHSRVNLLHVCRTTAVDSPDYESAATFLSDARRIVAEDLVPPGIWDVLEFEVALDFFVQEQLNELFVRAARSADANKRVAQEFMRVLAERGMLTPEGALKVPPREDQEAAQAGATDQSDPTSKIWTPDSQAVPGTRGKIWTPSS